jgi:hypothetical protein
MPLSHNIYSLSAGTPTIIVQPNVQPQEVHLHNLTKSSNEYIYVGSQSISTANSIHLDPGESLQINLGPGDDLWAVSDPGGLNIGVLVVKQD